MRLSIKLITAAALLCASTPAFAGNFISDNLVEFDQVSTRFADRMKEDSLVTALDCTTITTSYFDIMTAKLGAATEQDQSMRMVPLYMAKNTWSKVTDRLALGSTVPFSEVQAKSKILESQSSSKTEDEKTKFAKDLLAECMAPITWQFAQDKAFQTYLGAAVEKAK